MTTAASPLSPKTIAILDDLERQGILTVTYEEGEVPDEDLHA